MHVLQPPLQSGCSAVCGGRWANEQARQGDPDPRLLDDDLEAWDEALGFLGACGPVSRGHIARTVSTEHNLGASLRSHGSGLSSGFLEESQREVRPTPAIAPTWLALGEAAGGVCLSCARIVGRQLRVGAPAAVRYGWHAPA